MPSQGRYALKNNEKEARERLQAFWQGSSLGRPALQVTAANPEYTARPLDGPFSDPRVLEFLPEWQAKVALNTVEGTVWLAESMPAYAVGIGGHVPLLALLVGGDYDYPKDESGAPAWGPAWVETLEDVYERPVPDFDPSCETVTALMAIVQAVAEALDGRAIASPPCWVDPLTTLGNLRTEEVLCADLIERPDQVATWTDAATTLCLKANEHFYQECVRLGQGECVSWLGLMAEGRMDAVHCDFSIMLSPRMFAQFVIPTLERQAAYFDYAIYHLDGDANMRFLDQISAVDGIQALQYTRIAGSEYPGRCLTDYRLVREQGLSLYVNCDTVAEAVEVTQIVGPDGLYIVLPRFDTVADAERAIADITAASRASRSRA